MGLRILHSADWHLDSPFSSLPPQARERLRQVQRKLPGLVGQLLRQEECDLVLLAGDLFDGTPSRETVEGLKREFARWDVPVCIAPGNHDFCGPASPWLTESWPENVHIFTGGMEYIDFPALSLRVYGAGYRSMDCPPLLTGFRAGGDARVAVLIDVLPLWLFTVPLMAVCALVLKLPVIWVCLCLQSETVCKFPLGILRFRSRKWIHDITRSIE